MINEELLDYIKQQLDEGVSKENIKSNLIANGWAAGDVNEAFALIAEPIPIPQPSVPSAPSYSVQASFDSEPKSNLIKIIIGVFIILILGVGISLATKVWDPSWNPFRSGPEKVIAKMVIKQRDLKTVHSKIEISMEIEYEGNAAAISINISGDTDNTDLDNPKTTSDFNIGMDFEGMQFSFAGETKLIGKTSYFKLTTVPLPLQSVFVLMGIDVNELKNQWFKLDEDSIKNLLSKSLGESWTREMEEEIEKEKEKQDKITKEIVSLFQDRKIYLVKEELPDEKIGDTKVYHYVVSLNIEEIKKITPELLEKLAETSGEEGSKEEGNVAFSIFRARARAKEARIMTNMAQIRSMAELIYDYRDGYSKLSCNYSDNRYGGISKLCEDIANIVGAPPTIFTSRENYCVFAPLTVEGYYICMDNIGWGSRITEDPQRKGFCNGQTFICPEKVDIPEETRDKAAEEELLKSLEEFFDKIGEITAELWIGKKDNYLYKIKLEKELDLSQFENEETGKVNIKINMEFSDFNKPVQIEPPGTYETLEAILGKLFPQSPFLKAQKSALDARRMSDLAQIRVAMEMYYSDNNQYPKSATFPKKIGDYMATVPTDPGSGPCPSYKWISNTKDPQKYCIWACLEDGGFYAISQKGAKELFSPPTTLDCWTETVPAPFIQIQEERDFSVLEASLFEVFSKIFK